MSETANISVQPEVTSLAVQAASEVASISAQSNVINVQASAHTANITAEAEDVNITVQATGLRGPSGSVADLLLAPGITNEAGTIEYNITQGVEIAGSGNGKFSLHAHHVGDTSFLVRTGSSVDPLIRLTGRHCYLHDFTIMGRLPTDVLPQPNVGIQLAFENGTGPGSMTVERVTFQNLIAAIRLGENPTDNMCDTSILKGPSDVWNCDHVIVQENLQSMGNEVNGVEAAMLHKSFWCVNAGGSCTISKSAVTKVNEGDICSVFDIGSDSGVGSNNWTYTVRDFKADNQCGDRLQMLNMRAPKYLSFNVYNTHFSNQEELTPGRYIWNLHDGANILIMGGNGLLTKASVFVKQDYATYNVPTIHAIAHGQCWGTPEEIVAPGSAPVRLILDGCFGPDITAGHWKILANYNSVVTGA